MKSKIEGPKQAQKLGRPSVCQTGNFVANQCGDLLITCVVVQNLFKKSGDVWWNVIQSTAQGSGKILGVTIQQSN